LVEMRLGKFLSMLSLNHNALNISIPSSWDIFPLMLYFSPDALFFKTSTPQKVAQIVKLTIWLTNWSFNLTYPRLTFLNNWISYLLRTKSIWLHNHNIIIIIIIHP
jgi:hypothetical protein